jgi:hypothetical protein
MCVCVCVYVCMYVCVCARVFDRMCVCVCVRARVYVRAYVFWTSVLLSSSPTPSKSKPYFTISKHLFITLQWHDSFSKNIVMNGKRRKASISISHLSTAFILALDSRSGAERWFNTGQMGWAVHTLSALTRKPDYFLIIWRLCLQAVGLSSCRP